jgi:hypothetical protein
MIDLKDAKILIAATTILSGLDWKKVALGTT